MTYKLYYAPHSAAAGVRVLLEEIGMSYELIETTTDRSKPRPPEHMALNPNGWVPVLLWEDNAMYECAAITIFLCDRHLEAKLAPALDAQTQFRTHSSFVIIQTVSPMRRRVKIAQGPEVFAGCGKPGTLSTSKLVMVNGFWVTHSARPISISTC